MPVTTEVMWCVFAGVVLVMLVLDLGVFHRDSHVVRVREAFVWTGVWIAIAFCFMGFVLYMRGRDAAFQFLSGYLLEEALSIDNLFVIILIFSHFRVPAKYQHRVLFWGILGVLIMRGFFIGVGVELVHRFEVVMYVFGVILIVSGIKMALHKDKELDLEKNVILRLCRRFIPVSEDYSGGQFFVKKNGKRFATLLFIVLIIVETTDIIFAMDSVPAIFAVSRDPFIIYSSNVFAILGLRSLYFALAGLMSSFHLLNYGLCAILCFVGSKILIVKFYEVPIVASLSVIAGVLVISIVASLIWPESKSHTSSMVRK